MIVTNELYKKYVLDDLKQHKGLLHPIKAPLLERIRTKQISPKKLHPNPEDEFSMENIGPNWEIVSDYEEKIRDRLDLDRPIFDEKLIGVKLDKGGYMLINGHHRWMAALNVTTRKGLLSGFKYDTVDVPLRVVNITEEDDIYRVVNKSDRDKCATIDLDEVLLTGGKLSGIGGIFYDTNLRSNTALLIKELQRLGFDVWVYTGSYKSEAYIRGYFSMNHCQVDGVVNGINGKHKNKSVKLREIFRSKYRHIVHVDNNMITCVNTATKDYEMVDINSDEAGFAAAAVEKIKELPIY